MSQADPVGHLLGAMEVFERAVRGSNPQMIQFALSRVQASLGAVVEASLPPSRLAPLPTRLLQTAAALKTYPSLAMILSYFAGSLVERGAPVEESASLLFVECLNPLVESAYEFVGPRHPHHSHHHHHEEEEDDEEEEEEEEEGDACGHGHSHSHGGDHGHSHSHGGDHGHSHGGDHGHSHSHGGDHGHSHSHGGDHGHSHGGDHGHSHSHGGDHGRSHGGDHGHSHSHGGDDHGHSHGGGHGHSHGGDHGHSHSHGGDHGHSHGGASSPQQEAFEVLGQMCPPAVHFLTAHRAAREALAHQPSLVQKMELLRWSGAGVRMLHKLLSVLEDERFTILHPSEKKGYVVRISGVADNRQLHVLLMDSLCRLEAKERLSGTPPAPPLVNVCKNPEAEQEADQPIVGLWDLGHWTSCLPGHERDEVPDDGVPADVCKFRGERVLILRSTAAAQKAWACIRVFRSLLASIRLEGILPPSEVERFLADFAAASEDEVRLAEQAISETR